MDGAIILFVEGDQTAADKIARALPRTRVMKVSIGRGDAPIAFGPHLPLIFAWSDAADAARIQMQFAAVARAHTGLSVVAQTDSAPAPQGFGAVLSLGQGDFAAAVARAEADKLDAENPNPRTGRAFAAGLARGLVGGVAAFGVGGIAIGASSQIDFSGPDASTVEAAPALQGVTADGETWTAMANTMAVPLDAPVETLAEPATLVEAAEILAPQQALIEPELIVSEQLQTVAPLEITELTEIDQATFEAASDAVEGSGPFGLRSMFAARRL